MLASEPVLTLPKSQILRKKFEIECDANIMGVGVVLSQNKHSMAFFSEKLAEGKI